MSVEAAGAMLLAVDGVVVGLALMALDPPSALRAMPLLAMGLAMAFLAGRWSR